jgi:ATP-dependent DNA helicase RecQ
LLISEYVQEIGRAGRDGKPAEALMLISEPTGWLDPEDKQRQKFFEENLHKQQLSAQQVLKKLPKTGEVNAVAREFPNGAIALSLLHSSGQLQWLDPFHYTIVPGAKTQPVTQLHAAKQMNQYLTTKQCRWRFLLSAFGFEEEMKNWRCGHCDNCRR